VIILRLTIVYFSIDIAMPFENRKEHDGVYVERSKIMR
jgi:hypothetical protein